MFHFQVVHHRNLLGMRYVFPNVGDGIALHDHPEDQKHNVIILAGRIAIYGPDKSWLVELKTGDMMDLLDEHHPHEIYALEPETVMLSYNYAGSYEGVEFMPEDERVGTVTKKMPTMVP